MRILEPAAIGGPLAYLLIERRHRPHVHAVLVRQRDRLAHQYLRLHMTADAVVMPRPCRRGVLEPVEPALRSFARAAFPVLHERCTHEEWRIAAVIGLDDLHFGDL